MRDDDKTEPYPPTYAILKVTTESKEMLFGVTVSTQCFTFVGYLLRWIYSC